MAVNYSKSKRVALEVTASKLRRNAVIQIWLKCWEHTSKTMSVATVWFSHMYATLLSLDKNEPISKIVHPILFQIPQNALCCRNAYYEELFITFKHSKDSTQLSLFRRTSNPYSNTFDKVTVQKFVICLSSDVEVVHFVRL